MQFHSHPSGSSRRAVTGAWVLFAALAFCAGGGVVAHVPHTWIDSAWVPSDEDDTLDSGEEGARVARLAMPSLVALCMEDSDGKPTKAGTGFFIAPGIVATCAHVVSGAAGGSATLVDGSRAAILEGIIALDPIVDLALVRVTGIRGPPLHVSEQSVIVGQTIYAIGNPQGLMGTVSQGIVSAIRERGDGTELQITAAISHGSSGGPVLDSEGGVVGVAARSHDGQNLNCAVPASDLKELLKRSRTGLTFEPVSPGWADCARRYLVREQYQEAAEVAVAALRGGVDEGESLIVLVNACEAMSPANWIESPTCQEFRWFAYKKDYLSRESAMFVVDPSVWIGELRESARLIFEGELEKDPLDVEALIGCAQATTRARERLPLLRKAYAIYPESWSARWYLGRTLVEIGRLSASRDSLDEGISLLEKALQDPEDLTVAIDLAHAYEVRMVYSLAEDLSHGQAQAEEGVRAQVVAVLEKAVQSDPEYVAAWVVLGQQASTAEQRNKCFAAAIGINPNRVSTYCSWAERLERDGDLGEAGVVLERAAEIAPLDITVLSSLGRVYSILDPSKAYEFYRRLSSLDDRAAESLFKVLRETAPVHQSNAASSKATEPGPLPVR